MEGGVRNPSKNVLFVDEMVYKRGTYKDKFLCVCTVEKFFVLQSVIFVITRYMCIVQFPFYLVGFIVWVSSPSLSTPSYLVLAVLLPPMLVFCFWVSSSQFQPMSLSASFFLSLNISLSPRTFLLASFAPFYTCVRTISVGCHLCALGLVLSPVPPEFVHFLYNTYNTYLVVSLP